MLDKFSTGRHLIRTALVISSFSSFAALGQELVWLPSAPTPEQIVGAKTAFESGSVVAMRNADAARFSGILNVGLPTRDPENGAIVARHCIAAATKTSRGRVRLFAGDLVKPGRNDSVACARDFDGWLSAQQLLQDTEDPNGWTEINNYTAKNTSLSGDEYLRTTTLYRANTTDPNNDYFMLVQENNANAASNSIVVSNSTQLEATYGDARSASPFDFGPPLGVSTTNTFTIGSRVPIQTGSAALIVSWNGVTGLANNTFKVQNDPAAIGFGQQIASSGSSTLNVPSLLYDAGLIFNVPKGTTSVLGISTLTSFFQDGSGASIQYPGPGQFNVRGIAPVLSASAMDLFVTPGSTGNVLQITASSYLNWTLTTPDWIETDGPVTGGQGGQTISFSVDSGATVGTIGIISLDTSPSFASPSVASGPLQVRVHVTLAPPANGVLFAGGIDWQGNTLASADIWDPATKTVVPTNGPMGTARSSHTATLLPNGKIFIAGGFGSDGNALESTEIFDPATDTFAPGPDMVFAHAAHTATLSPQFGTVLIAGGSATTGDLEPTTNAEIYDPNANTITQVGSMAFARQSAAAVLLNSGEVVVVGGILPQAPIELYDPVHQSFSPGPGTSPVNQYPIEGTGQVAVQLTNDQVLALGGQFDIPPIFNGFLYTPSTGNFSKTTGTATNTGIDAAGVLLPDQTAVIFAGGKGLVNAPTPATGLTVGYNPSSETFTTFASGAEDRVRPTAALVPAIPAVVVAGGVPTGSGSSNGTAVELFDATQKSWSVAGTMSTARMGMTSTYFTNTSSVTSTNKQK